MTLTGKTALVTGASKGIGRSIALALAQGGADVAVNYHRDQEGAEEIAKEIQNLGCRADTIQTDVSDHEAVEQMVGVVARNFGRLDIVVTNACYSDREPFYEADMAGFRRTIDVTMWGAFHVLRAASRQMIDQKQGGSLVVISSPHSYIPVPNAMAYNMAKAALDQMARTAAIELIEHRIRVNMVHPGWIDTPGERKFTSDQELHEIGKNLPWGRLGNPDEVARGVVFFCDPASDYMTGSSLLIDGGLTLPWWSKGGTAIPEQQP